MRNSTSVTNDAGAVPSQRALVATLLIFVGLLVPVLVLPTFQFVLYVADDFEKFKNRHLAAFLTVQSLKYLFILLVMIANVDSIRETSSVTVHLYLYFHLAAFLWLCIASRASFNVVVVTTTTAATTKRSMAVGAGGGGGGGGGGESAWLRHTAAVPLALVAAAALLAAVRYAATAAADQAFADRYCGVPERCHRVCHLACFEGVKFVLLALCIVDLASAQCRRTHRQTRPPPPPPSPSPSLSPSAADADPGPAGRGPLDDLDLVALNCVLCALCAASCAAEVVGFVFVPAIGVVLTVVSLAEGWALSLAVVLFLCRRRVERNGQTQPSAQLPLVRWRH